MAFSFRCQNQKRYDALRLTAKNEMQVQPPACYSTISAAAFCVARQAGEDALRRSIRILAKAVDILQPKHGVPRQFLIFLLIDLLRPQV